MRPRQSFSLDERGTVLTVKLRSAGAVRFGCAHSWGVHADILAKIVSGELKHGDCKIQHDDERRKWYVLLSYEQPDAAPMSVDPARVLAVHRGVRNALYPILASGESAKALCGRKFVAQRFALQSRARDAKRITSEELGGGAKGHGRARRVERYSLVEDKIARVTTTWCQQAAAWVANLASEKGCGMVIIEDYGGIAPNPDRAIRRVLERFPFYELKQAIKSRLECVTRKDGTTVAIALKEVSSTWISSKCPRCEMIESGCTQC